MLYLTAIIKGTIKKMKNKIYFYLFYFNYTNDYMPTEKRNKITEVKKMSEKIQIRTSGLKFTKLKNLALREKLMEEEQWRSSN